MKTVKLHRNHIEICSQSIKIENNRFYADPVLFEMILTNHKTDIDFFMKSNIKDGKEVEFVIISDPSKELVKLEAYNREGGLIWKSQDIKDVYFEGVFFYIGLFIISCFGALYFVFK